jgi:hypothetical protein
LKYEDKAAKLRWVGGAQRPVWRANESKQTGARSARARTRGKNPLVLKIVPKATYNFCSGFPSLSLVDFFRCKFMAGFRNNFQALSKQLMVSQAAIGKREPAYWKDVHN